MPTVTAKPDYLPPLGLRNPHTQTILSSVGPRKWLLRAQLKSAAIKPVDRVLHCADGVRLYSRNFIVPGASSLVVLIHGWEGSYQSAYMLSMTNSLLRCGISVACLHLRDHGPSHHLNKGLFNSTLLPEVIDGVELLQQQLPHRYNFLMGFSLGGNFALRVAAQAHLRAIRLNKVIAISPALNPAACSDSLNRPQHKVYEQYFVRKWKKSLQAKLKHFPDYDYADDLASITTLDGLNEYFIPKYTQYEDLRDYYKAYTVTGETLSDLAVPCHLVTSQDDPVVPWQNLQELPSTDLLQCELTEYGGHCAYLNGFFSDVWYENRCLRIMKEALA